MTSPPTAGVPVLTVPQAQKLITQSQPTGNLNDPVQVATIIGAATKMVENIAGPIVVTQYTRSWSGGMVSQILPSKPLLAYDFAVVENGVTLTQNVDYTVDPTTATVIRGVYQALRTFWMGTYNVTVTWWTGREVVPAHLQMAVAEAFRLLWQVGRNGPVPAFGNDQMAQVATTGYGDPFARVVMLAQGAEVLGGFA